MNYNSISGLTPITASGTIKSDTANTNTLTTSGGALHIKSDLVLFKGLDNTIYMDAHPGGVLFYTDVYMEKHSKLKMYYCLDHYLVALGLRKPLYQGRLATLEQMEQ